MKSFIILTALLLISILSFGQTNQQHKRTQKLAIMVPKRSMSNSEAKHITGKSDSLKRAGFVVLDVVDKPEAYFLIYVKYSK